MSDPSTASSSPSHANISAMEEGERGELDDGPVTGSQRAYMDVLENPGHEQTRSSDVTVGRDSTRGGTSPITSAETSQHQTTVPRDGRAPFDLTSPVPSLSAQDRRRRLTGHDNHTRLQRTRSGGENLDGMRRGIPLPHRSASMIVPSSRSASHAAPGSSHDVPIDLSSSSPPSPYGSSGEDHVWSSENSPSASGVSQSARPLPTSSGSVPRTVHHLHDDGRPGILRPYSWNGSGVMAPGYEQGAGYANMMPHWSGTAVDGRGNASFRGIDGSDQPPQRNYQDERAQRPHVSRPPTNEQHRPVNTGTDARDNLPSTSPYYPGPDPSTRWPSSASGIISQGPGAYEGSFGRSEVTRRSSRRSTWHDREEGQFDELTPPRWQPDAEVSECPICGTVFSFWHRKHHCRKCGRVVCASCSPHRITIPRQFIVRPPDSTNLPSSTVPLTHPTIDLAGEFSSPSFVNPALGGGEEVRLCNPCVPDPNPNPPGFTGLRPHGHRASHSLSSTMGNAWSSEPRSNRLVRQERRTVGAYDRPSFLQETGRQARQYNQGTTPRRTSQELEVRNTRRVSVNVDPASTRVTTSRVAPPPPSQQPRQFVIPERDLCPVCRQRFPPITDEQPVELREAHIRQCIESFGGGPAQEEAPEQQGTTAPPVPSVVAQMVKFKATEKDCLGEHGQIAECTICMEDYEVGQQLARLQCFCKFHKTCIADWFERKRECPVHKVS